MVWGVGTGRTEGATMTTIAVMAAGTKGKHLWLTGTASAAAREQLRQRGWTLHEQSEAQLWARR
jgi:ribose 5-phosphate isomerase